VHVKLFSGAIPWGSPAGDSREALALQVQSLSKSYHWQGFGVRHNTYAFPGWDTIGGNSRV
jgi:hypothetical protein